MPSLILLALIAGALWIQIGLDTRRLRRLACERGWSVTRITWAPWPTGSAWRSRWDRGYRVRYRDASGRALWRVCWVCPAGVELEAERADGPAGRALARPLSPRAARAAAPTIGGRLARGLLGAFAGGWLGAAVGIGGAILLFPGSNIVPAYGLLLVAPLGALCGALVAVVRSRTPPG